MTGDPAPDAIERLRALCLAQPGATERQSHGEPSWFARNGRQFVMFSNHHHDDRVAFWCAAPPGAQAPLIESDPARYFRPPYVGHRGWVGVRLDGDADAGVRGGPDWAEVAEVCEDAYRAIAPQSLVTRLDV